MTRTMILRVGQAPSPDVALGALSVGHYILPLGFREEPMTKRFVEVFWSVKGRSSPEN